MKTAHCLVSTLFFTVLCFDAAANPIRIEAEGMTLSTFRVEGLPTASNGQIINLKGPGFVGNASTTFPGPAGNYDVFVGYHDENDGEAQLSVSIDGNPVDSWTLSELVIGGRQASADNFRVRQIASELPVSQGDVIQIDGLQGNWDHANVDYIEFIQEAEPETDNTATVAKQGGDYSDPVQALDDLAAWCNDPSRSRPCTLLVGPGRFEIGEPLLTQDLVDIVGSGEHASAITRVFETSFCDSSAPTVVHSAGLSTIADISIQSDCGDEQPRIVEVAGGLLSLRHVILRLGVPCCSEPTETAITVSNGAAILEHADVRGRVAVSDARIEIIDSLVTGGSEESGPTIRIDETATAEIVRSRLTGPDNTVIVSNRGTVSIDSSEILLDFVSTGVDNRGMAAVRQSTLRPLGDGVNGLQAIANSSPTGSVRVHLSTIEGNATDGSFDDLIANTGERFTISQSVIRQGNVVDDTMTLSCLFVTNGEGAELGSDCR